MRSKEKDPKTGRGAPGLAALVSAAVLACFAFVFVGAAPSGAHAQRPHGVDLTVRSLVAPAVVSGAKLHVGRHGCQQGGPNGEAIEGPCIPLARQAQRSRRCSASGRQVDRTTRAGRDCSRNGNREDPTEHGHRSLVPDRLRGRKARRQQRKRLPSIVAPYHRLELPGCFEYRAYRFAEGVHWQHHRLNAGRGDREPEDQWLRDGNARQRDDPQLGDPLQRGIRSLVRLHRAGGRGHGDRVRPPTRQTGADTTELHRSQIRAVWLREHHLGRAKRRDRGQLHPRPDPVLPWPADPHTDGIQMPSSARSTSRSTTTRIYGGYIDQTNFGNAAITGRRVT